ncbi:MAG: xylulokinase [Lachnospiraceae bacterium]|jgi:xylulokinase|nr:xylulokinase [Lachnospiraceae bacterium]
MERDLILAYDIGTSSVKTSVVSRSGEILASKKRDYTTSHPAAGISEQNPMDWWECVCKTTEAITEANPGYAGRIAVIGVSGHMLGSVPVDKEGNPVHPALIHSDSRAVAQYEKIKELVGADRLYRMSGNVLDARSSLCKMLWFQEERPGLYGRIAKFLQSKDFLVSRLTGNIDTTDCSDASHGEMMDIRKRAYDSSLYEELGLEMSKLPTLHAGMDIVGHLKKDCAELLGLTEGIPVIAGGGDGACADIGAGNVNTGDTYCSLGTTAWLSRCVEEPYLDEKQRVFNIMSLDGVHSSLFGTMQSAGGALKWVMSILGERDLGEFNRLAAEAAPGSNGLIFQPYLDGERSPIFDAKARGMFFGLSLSHTRSHFMRATFEGVAYALNSILKVFEEQGRSEQIRIIGGGANSELWKQILADVWKTPVAALNASADDSTSLGVAAAAGAAAGLFGDLKEATEYIKVKNVTVPSSSQAEYDKYFAVYQKLYEDTKEEMHRVC